jgi:hypothetical protein
MNLDDIRSFNVLFAEAERRGIKMNWFTQDAAGVFSCSWRDGAGSCDEVKDPLPFIAMRNAFFCAIGKRDLVFGPPASVFD